MNELEDLEYEEAARYGDPRRCRRHGVAISSGDGMHDGVCGACEAEMDEDEFLPLPVVRVKNPLLVGEDLFDSFHDDEIEITPAMQVSRLLQDLRHGDTVLVGRTRWTVETNQGVVSYVVRTGTAGRKLYLLRPSSDGAEVVLVNAGTGDIISPAPVASGSIKKL